MFEVTHEAVHERAVKLVKDVNYGWEQSARITFRLNNFDNNPTLKKNVLFFKRVSQLSVKSSHKWKKKLLFLL